MATANSNVVLPTATLGLLQETESSCKNRGTKNHRAPNHISNTVRPTVKIGPLFLAMRDCVNNSRLWRSLFSRVYFEGSGASRSEGSKPQAEFRIGYCWQGRSAVAKPESEPASVRHRGSRLSAPVELQAHGNYVRPEQTSRRDQFSARSPPILHRAGSCSSLKGIQ